VPNTGRISSKKVWLRLVFSASLSYTLASQQSALIIRPPHIPIFILLFPYRASRFSNLTLQYSSKFALSMMTHECKTSSSTDSHFAPSQPSSKWSSSIGSRDTKPSNTNTMLSINFSTPLAGAARSERIKQMTNNHVSQRIPLFFCLLFYPS
jgi:hypothetical protein